MKGRESLQNESLLLERVSKRLAGDTGSILFPAALPHPPNLVGVEPWEKPPGCFLPAPTQSSHPGSRNESWRPRLTFDEMRIEVQNCAKPHGEIPDDKR